MQRDDKPAVLLEGDGIAAACMARLLRDAGVGCVLQTNARAKLAAILVGEQTQGLLRELFPASESRPGDLFEGFLRVRRRVVLWGEAEQELELPHSGVVAPEGELLRRLWERVTPMSAGEGMGSLPPLWHVRTTRGDAPEQSFGSREAGFALVELQAGVVADACWVESVPNGWLFLLALGTGRATLIAVGDTPECLLADSRLIARQIAGIGAPQASVAAHPRLSARLAGSDFIACGSAAMSFDPLCGEGAGNAVREAFLAAAVVRASLLGHSPELLAAHYTDRLRRGFLRHLQVCLQFYSTGGLGDFWSGSAASLVGGIEELRGLVAHEPAAQFRLFDRDLLPAQAD